MSWLLNILPASTIASWIAGIVTKALEKVDDKERAALIAEAVAAVGKATETTAKAVEDCKVTDEEVTEVTAAITTAVTTIIKAAK